jgi:hypothetical protein
MSVVDNLKSTQVTPKTAAIFAVITLIVVGGIICIVKSVMMPPQNTELATEITNRSPEVKVTLKDSVKTSTPAKAKKNTITAKPVDACVLIAQRNIFKPLVSSGPAVPGGNKPIPPITLGVIPSMPGGPGGMRGPGGPDQGKSKIAFTGIVQTPEGVMALLENTATNETKYVRVGDNAFGASVTEVSPSAVTIISEGQPVRLALGDNKISTPPPAATPPGAPGQGGPPQPGQGMPPGAMPPGAMPPTQPMPMVMPAQNTGGNRGARQGGGRRRNAN